MTKTKVSKSVIPVGRIENSIFLIRGQKVILDRDLAAIYGVPTFRFNEAVKRNRDRFPEDFMFQLTQEEKEKKLSSREQNGGHNNRQIACSLALRDLHFVPTSYRE